jgi:hypothetical protein
MGAEIMSIQQERDRRRRERNRRKWDKWISSDLVRVLPRALKEQP